jgi:hypothetical protein
MYGIRALESCRARTEHLFYFVAALLLPQSPGNAPRSSHSPWHPGGLCGDEGGSGTELPDFGGTWVSSFNIQCGWMQIGHHSPGVEAAIRTRPISSERRMATPRVSTIRPKKSLPNTVLPRRSKVM